MPEVWGNGSGPTSPPGRASPLIPWNINMPCENVGGIRSLFSRECNSFYMVNVIEGSFR